MNTQLWMNLSKTKEEELAAFSQLVTIIGRIPRYSLWQSRHGNPDMALNPDISVPHDLFVECWSRIWTKGLKIKPNNTITEYKCSNISARFGIKRRGRQGRTLLVLTGKAESTVDLIGISCRGTFRRCMAQVDCRRHLRVCLGSNGFGCSGEIAK